MHVEVFQIRKLGKATSYLIDMLIVSVAHVARRPGERNSKWWIIDSFLPFKKALSRLIICHVCRDTIIQLTPSMRLNFYEFIRWQYLAHDLSRCPLLGVVFTTVSTLISRRLNAYECASFFVLHYAHTVRKREWRLHCELRRVDSISRLLLPRVRWTEIWTWASIDRFNIELPSLETVYHQLSFKLKQSPANFKRMTTLSGLCKKDYYLTLMLNSQTIFVLWCSFWYQKQSCRSISQFRYSYLIWPSWKGYQFQMT